MALNKPERSRQQAEVKHSLSQQLRRALAQHCLCKHYCLLRTLRMNTAMCVHCSPPSQVSTALKDPFLRAHLKAGADAGAWPILTAPPPPPPPGHSSCAIWSVTRRQQIQFVGQQGQRNAKHIWPCRVAPHRWRSSYGSRTNPRLCLLLFGHHEHPGLCRMAAWEH